MLFRAILDIIALGEMAKLHSASPREITSPFPREIISKLHSKACHYLYKYTTRTLHIHTLADLVTILKFC